MPKRRTKTDHDYWEEVRPSLPDFMDKTYEPCTEIPCGVTARYVLSRFKKFVGKDGDISFHTFYNELRRLGYNLPITKGTAFDSNTRVTSIRLKEGA